MRKKYFILLALLALLIFQSNVYAWSGGIQAPSTGESGGPSSNELPQGNPIDLGTDSAGYSYTCNYRYSIDVTTNITLNTYNQKNELTNQTSITPTEKTLSGTAIGIEIFERKTIGWRVSDVKVTKTKETGTTYDCKSTGTYPDPECRGRLFGKVVPDCPYVHLYKWGVTSCGPGYTVIDTHGGKSEETLTSGEYYDDCKGKAEDAVKKIAANSMVPSYVVKLQNSNDMNATGTIDVYPNSCGLSDSNPSTCTYVYSVNKTCMNAKTGNVRYITNNSDKCLSDELEVANDSNHWHYFVPVTAKDDDIFFLSVSTAGKDSKQSANACKYVINNYSNYKELIIDSSEKQFTGEKSVDLSIASSGCYLSTVMNIPVTQKFYNLEKTSNKINGYGFFYRQIDITKPFNTEPSSNSLWYEWYNDKKSKNKNNEKYVPNFINSFDNESYTVSVINAKSIRDYNKSYFYTSWENMKLNGKSTFVDNFVTRKKTGDIYKLGCGPANKDWGGCK